MRIYNSLEEVRGVIGKPVCAVGNFDGVHLGHKAIFSFVSSHAAERGVESCVITFSNHPRQEIYPDEKIHVLTSLDEKISEIDKSGIDNLVLLKFTRELSLQSPGSFIGFAVIDCVGAGVLVAGYDHAIGRNREGDIDHIRNISAGRIDVLQAPPLSIDGRPVSSSRIRSDLSNGDVDSAACLLGRSYSIRGKVVRGFERGRHLGFPTANIMPDDSAKLVPLDGVYAVRVFLRGRTFNAVMNIGKNPTYGNSSRTIEVHIPEFSSDIYDEDLVVEFVKMLRGEITFTSIDDLKSAIRRDIDDALRVLS